MDIQDRMDMLNDAFNQYLLMDISNSQLESKLSKITSSIQLIPSKIDTFNVMIVSNKTEPIFFMRVLPSLEDNKSIEEIFSRLNDESVSYKEIVSYWKHLTQWNIEIDDRIFNRQKIAFNSRELTALLLHEIGHTVYSDRVIERLYRSYSEAKVRMTMADRAKIRIASFFYLIPLTVAASLHGWSIGENGRNEEIFCDNFVVKYGYGEDLVSAINKIIKAYGTSGILTSNTKDKVIDESINWCNINIIDLITRKKKLKNQLAYKTANTSSPTLKSVYINIMNRMNMLFKKKSQNLVIEPSVESVMEAFSDFNGTNYTMNEDWEVIYKPCQASILETYLLRDVNYKNIATEATLVDKMMKRKRDILSDYDLDAIEIEIDKIENHHDRIFVLDLIYKKISDLTEFRDVIAENPSLLRQYDRKIQLMLDRLEQLRKMVMAKKQIGTEYKLFVKVPAGYEG